MQLFAKIFPTLWFDPISKGIGKLQKMISQKFQIPNFGKRVSNYLNSLPFHNESYPYERSIHTWC
jgi:hypothetical protein